MKAFIVGFCLLLVCSSQRVSAHPTADTLAVWTEETWSLDELDNLKSLPAVEKEARRFILGDAHGFVHVFEQRGPAFEEVWISSYLEGAVGGIFIANIDGEGGLEILVYTEAGRFYLFDITDYRVLWSNPPNEYESITAMIVRNVDDDAQPELLFCGDGMLVIYDGLNRFEEWRSDENNIEATEIVVGDVDGDGAEEIVLNAGFVYDARFHDLEWQSPDSFGERLGMLDLDDDGIPEIIGEFGGGLLRVFDVDLRRTKSTRR